MKFRKICLMIAIAMLNIFTFFLFSTSVSASTAVSAQFTDNFTAGNFYQVTIKFKLSDEGNQLILYSPDYDSLNISSLEDQLGTDNVIADSEKQQVILNLNDEVKSDKSGSIIVLMKKSNSDILYVRDINNEDVANEDLVTGKTVSVNKTMTEIAPLQSNVSLPISDTISNSLLVNKSSMLINPVAAQVLTVPVITPDNTHVSDFNNDLKVTGTWESPNSSIDIYYQFRATKDNEWTYLGTYNGSANEVHNFTGLIPKDIVKELTAGTQNLFFTYSQIPKQSYKSTVTVDSFAESMKILMNGVETNTSFDDPYVARDAIFTISASLYTNIAGKMDYTIDGKTTSDPPLSSMFTGNVTLTKKIDLNNLSENDGRVHEAVFRYMYNDKILDSASFYFVVGNELRLTVPESISFGSHSTMEFLNGFNAKPTVTGQLALFDGRIGTYTGNLGLSASATSFKDSSGNNLNASLYWNNVKIPTDGEGIKIGELIPPTSTDAAYKNFTQDLNDNLVFDSAGDTVPSGGSYTSTITWSVNDTMQ